MEHSYVRRCRLTVKKNCNLLFFMINSEAKIIKLVTVGWDRQKEANQTPESFNAD